MTRHFVWLVPLINLVVFLGFGVLLALATRRWPARAGWWSPRLIIALAMLPGLAVAGRGIYLEAWFLVALGVAFRVAPVLERHPAGARRWMVRSVPVLLGLVLLQAGWIVGGDRIKQWREEAPSVASGRLAQRAADRAGHRAGGSPQRVRLPALPPRPPWSGWRRGESASTRHAHPPPGRSPRTPASSPDAGPMSSACNG